MSPKKSPEQELADQMEKLKAMGVTITVKSAPGAAFEKPRPSSFIAKAAKEAGIYHEQEGN